jgi:hypothetical protein
MKNNGDSVNAKTFRAWAQTPPMGWNSYDCYGSSVTEAEVKANAEYMARHLKPFGWEYVVVDFRWYVRNPEANRFNAIPPRYEMDSHGRLMPATNRFPSARGGKGFKPLADHVHRLGLKFGIHVMRGIPVEAVNRNTPILGSDACAADIHDKARQCEWLPDMYTIAAERHGAQEYYDSIFTLYAEWGVDYVKVDDLSCPYHASEIERIRRAIDKTGRPMVLSMSPGPTPVVQAAHALRHANLWRIAADLWDTWQDVAALFDLCKKWTAHGGPGHWPDADILPLGRIGMRRIGIPSEGIDRMSGLSEDEQITLVTLGCIARSPLMFGGDLPSNDEFTLSLLTNEEVLAVNQCSTQHRELYNRKGHIGWTADVPDSGEKYVALFNTHRVPDDSNNAEPMSFLFRDIGLRGMCKVRDLWGKKDVGIFSEVFTASVPCHGARIYRIVPNARAERKRRNHE